MASVRSASQPANFDEPTAIATSVTPRHIHEAFAGTSRFSSRSDVACNWSNLSLIAALRSLFYANKFPDPMLRVSD